MYKLLSSSIQMGQILVLTWLILDQMFRTSVQMYNDDPEAIYAVIAMVLSSFFLQANVYVTLRMLKGMQFTN